MLKIYCLELEEGKKTEFSISMSEKYKTINAKSISNFAWYCLEKIIFKEFGLQISNEMISYNEFNKPYLNNRDIFFNISHSKNFVLIGISDCEIGVDIESLIPKERANRLVKRFNKKIIDEYNECLNKSEYFTKKWVLIEAYSKLLGTGLNAKLFKSFVMNDDGFIISFYDNKSAQLFYCAVINQTKEKMKVIFNTI